MSMKINIEAVDSTKKSLPPVTTAKARFDNAGGHEETDPIELPDSMTRPEIIAATGLPNGSVKQAIWELQRAGLVFGTPKVRRDFSKYWRV